jgi:NAD(P)-dependent dehydrogenase (short-subunit alcohol dehydrogenase family)
MRMGRLDGRSAIVTGGARGIGRHYSQALAAEGARVMIADIADGTALAAEIAAQHGHNAVASATFDVSEEAAVKRVVAQTIERFGKHRHSGQQRRLVRAAAAGRLHRHRG